MLQDCFCGSPYLVSVGLVGPISACCDLLPVAGLLVATW